MTQTNRELTMTKEMAELVELYYTARPAYYREVEKHLARWCCEAVRRMRILVKGHTLDPKDGTSLERGMSEFGDLLADAERYGLAAQLQGELDEIRARWLFRPNQARVPNRWAR